jgi:DNA primase
MSERNHYDIAEIKARLDIFDVLQHFGFETNRVCKLMKSPLRDERSPSFSVFAKGQAAKDHGTGESFDCISLYQALAGCDKHQAIVECGKLANLEAGAIPPEFSVPPPPRSVASKATKAETDENTLRHKLGAATDEVIAAMLQNAREFLNDQKPNILTDFCSRKRFDHGFIRKMIDAGMIGILVHPAIRRPAIAWIFRNPIFGVGVKLRFTAESSHATMWWAGKSSEHFFGEQLVQPVIAGQERSRIFVTEGESDCLVLLQQDLPSVGVVGSGVMPDMRITYQILAHRNVGVWYDNDKAGIAATEKIQDHILKNASGSAVFRGIGNFIPQGSDIGDCWAKYGEKFADRAKKEFDILGIDNKITTTLPKIQP